jgi:hypothetical protein
MRGCWSASLEEHFNAPWEDYLRKEDVFEPALKTDYTIFQGLRRSLDDELHLEQSEIERTKLSVLGVGFEYYNFNTALYAMAELPPDLTAKRLSVRLQSPSEHDLIAWCPFDFPQLKPIFINGSPPEELEVMGEGVNMQWKWNTTSRLRIALAVARRFGKSKLWELLELIHK